ncbi:hypothetical protein [Alloalcanivorax gelatiniphagus]|uniref:Uncharacterized protein n=1 Tax=Alloalcanivorax gelatiniphagus TaxID=1194167 RepID=A0ABY2XNW4_9GAMM|nr:hypothetical protein [Alloalcanivorax gelatiniphagus]TMW13749.1 hypothetical protein FGS76_06375 [Alloalcanivorax gelatiniphagus]
MVYQGKKLVKFERRIGLDVAAEYFSDLVGFPTDIDAFERLAYGRIPFYMEPRQASGIASFVGMTEEQYQAEVGKTTPITDSSLRCLIPLGGRIFVPEFIESELPFPLFQPVLDGITCTTPTEDGDQIHWFLWKQGANELWSFGPYDVDFLEIVVSPKDVHSLAEITNDESCWPDHEEGCISRALVHGRSQILRDKYIEICSVRALPATAREELESNEPIGAGQSQRLNIGQSVSPHLAIAGMVRLLRESTNHTQDSIQEYIGDAFGGARGTSKSALQKLFRDANAAGEEALK